MTGVNRRQFLGTGAFAPAAARTERDGLPFRAGFSQQDITPEIGAERPGNYVKNFHKKFHDPCKVRASVFDDGTRRVALVGVDALMVPRALVQAARTGIRNRCGIQSHEVLIAATHSHSSGPVGMVQPGQFDHAPAPVRRLAYNMSTCADARYLRLVESQIVAAVCEADRRRVSVRCSAGSGREDRVSFNRRFRMKNGRTYTNPRQGNPDVVDAAGPIDPEVGVLGAWSADGRLMGCIVNFACHGTTSRPAISANWIYDLEQTIQGMFGRDVAVLFLPGASGDVTQVDNRSPYVGRQPDESARYVGGRIGAEAIKVLLSAHPGTLAPVAALSTTMRIRRRAPSPDRVRRAYEMVKRESKAQLDTEWIFAKETVLLDALIAREPVAEVEVQAIQLGPVVYVTNPAELFCQFGLDLKAGSSFPLTFPVELANGCVGYVPTEEAFGSAGGGYETRLTKYSNLEVCAGRRIVEAGLQLVSRLKPRPLPQPAKAPAFRAGSEWSYGNVPAELQ